MKTLSSILNEVANNWLEPKLDETVVRVGWDDDMIHVAEWAKKNEHTYIDMCMSILDKMADEFIAANPRKAFKKSCNIEFVMKLDTSSDRSLLDIYRELDKLGADSWMRRLNYKSINRIDITYKKHHGKVDTDIKKHFSPLRNTQEFGNGYNDLPGELITELREKVLDCFKATNIFVRFNPSVRSFPQGDAMIFQVILTPIVDVPALRRLSITIAQNKTWDGYRARLQAAHDGIRSYYDEKRRSGDNYTGD